MKGITDADHAGNREAPGILAGQLDLTLRQAEVLHWIAEGKTNDEIATILECSINTVKAHLKDIFRHLGLHTRTAAAACAYRAHIRHASQHDELPVRVIPENRSVR